MLLAFCGNEDAMATLRIPLLVSDLLVPWLLHSNEKITVKLNIIKIFVFTLLCGTSKTFYEVLKSHKTFLWDRNEV